MITVSPEKATALRAAGWDQKNAHFDWCIDGGGSKTIDIGKSVLRYRTAQGRPRIDCIDPIAAPGAEEIMMEIIKVKNIVITPAPFSKGGWRINYDVRNGSAFCDTPSNALSDMWIYLKTNNLLPSGSDE